ncbi:MAG: hypothetical protein CSA18_00185 [Deltaproteobacteria bacterium]|nr:MAG: hypothetical protein CSA18_00185 [Deltaproteobacteria bacterium]
MEKLSFPCFFCNNCYHGKQEKIQTSSNLKLMVQVRQVLWWFNSIENNSYEPIKLSGWGNLPVPDVSVYDEVSGAAL